MNIADLTTAQLRSIIDIKERIESLQTQLDSVGGGDKLRCFFLLDLGAPGVARSGIMGDGNRRNVNELKTIS